MTKRRPLGNANLIKLNDLRESVWKAQKIADRARDHLYDPTYIEICFADISRLHEKVLRLASEIRTGSDEIE